MSIRTLCVAAAIAVGVGQAEAATTVDYDLWLRYEGTAFTSIDYAESGPDGDLLFEGDTSVDAMLPGTKSHLFGSVAIGKIVHLVMKIVHPDIPVEDNPYYGNGGRTPICQMGAWDCTGTNYTSSDFRNGIPGVDFANARDDEWSLMGSILPGSTVFVSFWAFGHAPYPHYSDDGAYQYWYDSEYSSFTVVPSPVPLPATAALLSIGIGALAMMRRRQGKLTRE